MENADTDKGILISHDRLQSILKTVRENGENWDVITWTGLQYPIVPVLPNPDKLKLAKIKGRHAANHYLMQNQKDGWKNAECDVIMTCDEGSVPCHRAILVHFAPFLKELINENVKEIGVPSCKNPIAIHVADCSLSALTEAITFLYNGDICFAPSICHAVLEILKLFKLDKSVLENVQPHNPTPAEAKKTKRCLLTRCQDVNVSESSSSETDSDDAMHDRRSRPRQRTSRNGDAINQWVNQTASVNKGQSTQGSYRTRQSYDMEEALKNEELVQSNKSPNASKKVTDELKEPVLVGDKASSKGSTSNRASPNHPRSNSPGKIPMKKPSSSIGDNTSYESPTVAGGSRSSPPRTRFNSAGKKSTQKHFIGHKETPTIAGGSKVSPHRTRSSGLQSNLSAHETNVTNKNCEPIATSSRSSEKQLPPPRVEEYKKVAPGSLIIRQPQPRIRRPNLQPKTTVKRKRNSTGSSMIPSNTGATTQETQASTSKGLVEHEHAKVSYGHDEDFEPCDQVASSSSLSESNDSSDSEKVHFVEMNLRRRVTKYEINKATGNGSSLSLVDRLKLNPRCRRTSGDVPPVKKSRYPKRKRKRTLNVSQNLVTTCESEAAVEEDSDDSDAKSPDSKYLAMTGSTFNTKCFFCKIVYDTEELLAEHSVTECGKHLKEQYKYPEKICLICSSLLDSLSHYGLIRHVQYCFCHDSPCETGISVEHTSEPLKAEVGETELVENLPTSEAKSFGNQNATDSQSAEAPDGENSVVYSNVNESPSEPVETQVDENEENDAGALLNLSNNNPTALRIGSVSSANLSEAKSNENAGFYQMDNVEPDTTALSHEHENEKKSDVQSMEKIVKTEEQPGPSNSDTVETKTDEIIPMGNPKVVMQKLSDELVANIIIQIRNGGTVDIPRLAGYNYVRVMTTPKDEMPDFYPDDSDEMTAARIRDLEKEQEESRIASEMRQLAKKMQMAKETQTASPTLVVPPLILNRSMAKADVAFKARDIFRGFTMCSCGDHHSTIRKALKCLQKRKLKKCWICCIELSQGHPVENHLRSLHYEERHPGQISCPVCKSPLYYSDINQHMYEVHFKSKTGCTDDEEDNVDENCPPEENDVQIPTDSDIQKENNDEVNVEMDQEPNNPPIGKVQKRRGRPPNRKPGPIKIKPKETPKASSSAMDQAHSSTTINLSEIVFEACNNIKASSTGIEGKDTETIELQNQMGSTNEVTIGPEVTPTAESENQSEADVHSEIVMAGISNLVTSAQNPTSMQSTVPVNVPNMSQTTSNPIPANLLVESNVTENSVQSQQPGTVVSPVMAEGNDQLAIVETETVTFPDPHVTITTTAEPTISVVNSDAHACTLPSSTSIASTIYVQNTATNSTSTNLGVIPDSNLPNSSTNPSTEVTSRPAVAGTSGQTLPCSIVNSTVQSVQTQSSTVNPVTTTCPEIINPPNLSPNYRFAQPATISSSTTISINPAQLPGLLPIYRPGDIQISFPVRNNVRHTLMSQRQIRPQGASSIAQISFDGMRATLINKNNTRQVIPNPLGLQQSIQNTTTNGLSTQLPTSQSNNNTTSTVPRNSDPNQPRATAPRIVNDNDFIQQRQAQQILPQTQISVNGQPYMLITRNTIASPSSGTVLTVPLVPNQRHNNFLGNPSSSGFQGQNTNQGMQQHRVSQQNLQGSGNCDQPNNSQGAQIPVQISNNVLNVGAGRCVQTQPRFQQPSRINQASQGFSVPLQLPVRPNATTTRQHQQRLPPPPQIFQPQPQPPQPKPIVHTCPKCSRLFKSETLFDTHLCVY